MPHIQQLDAHVADLIAAGEVVERPASVVKELVENAIDAGATAVVVETRRGGMGLIRVTDNGCGIAPEEMPTAFLRHATSKLRREEELGCIGTLGFRGEALAAICAVSRVELLSRCTGAEAGAELMIEGGEIGRVRDAGAPEGTTIQVRDLFYNTPARLKFMRKDSAETAAVNGLMQHLALSHPAVSFRYIKDGVEALHTPGDGRLDSAVYAAQGRDFARSLIPVEGESGGIAVKGFVTKPLLCRGSRTMQTFFVNGRFIKSQLLTAALEESYRNQMMKGRFPGCVLAVTLPVSAVDVNVHPAKTQVKFARDREVFDAVYYTVKDALECLGSPIKTREEAKANPLETGNPRQDFYQNMDAKTYREKVKLPVRPGPQAPARPAQSWTAEWRTSVPLADSQPEKTSFYQHDAPSHAVPKAPAMPEVQRPSVSAVPAAAPAGRPQVKESPMPAASAGDIPEAQQQSWPPAIPQAQEKDGQLPGQARLLPREEAPWRIAGELLHTYIICESEDQCVYLIDKHAAHERVNFDRMEKAQEPPMRQTLLRPIVVEPAREDGQLLLENLPLLAEFGFSCEDFGDGAVLVREVPADIDAADAGPALEEFAEKLRSGRSPAEKREALLHTMACKASIKGGWTSDPAELRVLVDKVQSGEVKYCPHGRPVAVKLTKYELEKLFKRA